MSSMMSEEKEYIWFSNEYAEQISGGKSMAGVWKALFASYSGFIVNISQHTSEKRLIKADDCTIYINYVVDGPMFF